MLVKGWMTGDVITVNEVTPMMKASVIMKERDIRSLPVLNKKGKLVGIISDRDLKDASPSKATSLDVYELNYLISTVSVKSIMTKNPVCVRPNETIEFAAILMLENRISSLPVMNDQDALIGIITQTDIFKVLINIMGVYTAGIQIALSLEDRPGSIKEASDLIRSHGGSIDSILSTRELAEQGRRNVYIRIGVLAEDKARALVEALEKGYLVLYTVRDLLEEVERRRIRIAE